MRVLLFLIFVNLLLSINLFAAAGHTCIICGTCTDIKGERVLNICKSAMADIKEDTEEAALMAAQYECRERTKSEESIFAIENNSCRN